MSYRLINSNEIAIKYPEVNDMLCIYADIPNGLNGDFYDLSVYPKIVEKLEQPTVDVLDKIRDEIEEHTDGNNHCDEYLDGYNNGMKDALEIIDKYKS